MNTKSHPRESGVIEQPEQYVTVEIHNSNFRKKLRNHRESIIKEMKHTEGLLEETLNKNLRHPKSKFTPMLTAQTTPHKTAKFIPQPPTQRDRGELSRKLRQICNISQHFDKACEYRKKARPTLQVTQQDTRYALPVATPHPPPSPSTRRAKEQLFQHKTMVREWQSKVRLGREFLKKRKMKSPLRVRALNKGTEAEQQQNPIKQSTKPSLSSLRDIYFSELRPQRKSAPLTTNQNLQLLFLNQREKRSRIGYVGSVQNEPALQIQSFIQGGKSGGFVEYGDWLSLSQFRRSRQRSQMLDKLYNHVKENNLYEFKDMNAQKFTSQSLLAVVYYLENANNLTEHERRMLRRKLRVVE